MSKELNRMGKKDFKRKYAEVSGGTQIEAEKVLANLKQTFEELVVEVGDVLDLQQFLRLEKVLRAARKGRNPQTGEEIDIDAKEKIKAEAKF